MAEHSKNKKSFSIKKILLRSKSERIYLFRNHLKNIYATSLKNEF